MLHYLSACGPLPVTRLEGKSCLLYDRFIIARLSICYDLEDLAAALLAHMFAMLGNVVVYGTL